MKKFIILCIAFSLNAHAENFQVDANERPLSIVEWRASEDIQRDCDIESKKRKFNGFNYELAACSFWRDDFCLIITSKSTTVDVVGHELRHCFQGNFH